jgi:hypothetical protein
MGLSRQGGCRARAAGDDGTGVSIKCAMAAERETTDRLIADHLADCIGAEFEGRIAGVTRSGLFVRLKDTGADGFVPVSSLIGDLYRHVEGARARRHAQRRGLPARRQRGAWWRRSRRRGRCASRCCPRGRAGMWRWRRAGAGGAWGGAGGGDGARTLIRPEAS